MTEQRKWIPQDIHIVNPPCSSQSLGSFLFKREAWNCMPRLKLEVLRKPLRQIWIQQPTLWRENHYAIPCTKSEISYVSNLQDKHNASFFPVCFEKSCLYPTTKVGNFSDNLLSSNAFIYFWNRIQGAFYIFSSLSCLVDAVPKPFLHSFAFCLNHCTSGTSFTHI